MLWCFSLDVAEQYFQDSMANLKDAEGMEKARFLSIQDDYCHFLQVTGQDEVSEFGPQLAVIYSGNPVDIQRATPTLCKP